MSARSRKSVLKFILTAVLIYLLLGATSANAQMMPAIPRITIGVDAADGPEEVALSLQILILLTVLSLAPAILVTMTSFTRSVVVLSFVRNAIATNQMPPNQILIGLALLLTVFIMAPTWQAINTDALQPYMQGEITQAEALDESLALMREFMYKNTREKDLELFVTMARAPRPQTPGDVPTHIIIPAFVISELKTAFQLGFVIFIPFIVIDMIVASILMSMGMLMLPPVMISLPFKILLFVMVDGWHLVVQSLLLSYR
ncbi:MAG: flagellar type III secretion system pore protein FliP [Firmicutes bacterium]|nr:flagellar type III secretion system pore protein FliP [Bacillota bacterium]